MTNPTNEALVEEVWEELKARCCADPKKAKRIVMFKRSDLEAIIPIVQKAGEVSSGWIIGNGSQTEWRAWDVLGPIWVSDPEKATRYARREDAEAAHAEDEDAWLVIRYADAIARGEHRK